MPRRAYKKDTNINALHDMVYANALDYHHLQPDTLIIH